MSITINDPTVINNGLVWKVTSKSGDYTTTSAEYVINVTTSSANITITLADGLTAGTVYYINKIDSTSNKVIVSPAGSGAAINGGTTFDLENQYDCVTVYLGSTSPNLWFNVSTLELSS